MRELRKLLDESEAEKEALRRELHRVTRGVHRMTGDDPAWPLWDEPAYLPCLAWDDPTYVHLGSMGAARALHASETPAYVVPMEGPAHEPSMPGSSTTVDGVAPPPATVEGNDEAGEVEVDVDDEGGESEEGADLAALGAGLCRTQVIALLATRRSLCATGCASS